MDTKPFIVKTDAANSEGLGGVLSQADDDGKEHETTLTR